MINTNESGRSMVEMLGVLAIIGVLSIGGIAGYTLAMNRYRANEILNAASLVSIAAMSGRGGAGEIANMEAIDGLSVPAIESNDDIKAYPNGIVEIQINQDYDRVINLVNTLSGGRVVSGETDLETGKIVLNMANGVRTAS